MWISMHVFSRCACKVVRSLWLGRASKLCLCFWLTALQSSSFLYFVWVESKRGWLSKYFVKFSGINCKQMFIIHLFLFCAWQLGTWMGMWAIFSSDMLDHLFQQTPSWAHEIGKEKKKWGRSGKCDGWLMKTCEFAWCPTFEALRRNAGCNCLDTGLT